MTLESQALIQRCDGALVLLAGEEGMHFARTDGSTAVLFWGSCALVAACVCVAVGRHVVSVCGILGGGQYVPCRLEVLGAAGVLLLLLPFADPGDLGLVGRTLYSLSSAV